MGSKSRRQREFFVRREVKHGHCSFIEELWCPNFPDWFRSMLKHPDIDISAAEAARRCGLSSQHLNNILNKQDSVGWDIYVRLMRVIREEPYSRIRCREPISEDGEDSSG